MLRSPPLPNRMSWFSMRKLRSFTPSAVAEMRPSCISMLYRAAPSFCASAVVFVDELLASTPLKAANNSGKDVSCQMLASVGAASGVTGRAKSLPAGGPKSRHARSTPMRATSWTLRRPFAKSLGRPILSCCPRCLAATVKSVWPTPAFGQRTVNPQRQRQACRLHWALCIRVPRSGAGYPRILKKQ